ncbi:hypothetical protein TWF281_004312 [Arthrobotrys megalospora]
MYYIALQRLLLILLFMLPEYVTCTPFPSKPIPGKDSADIVSQGSQPMSSAESTKISMILSSKTRADSAQTSAAQSSKTQVDNAQTSAAQSSKSQADSAQASTTQSLKTDVNTPPAQQTNHVLVEKVVDPSFFYTVKGLHIRCNSPEFVYELKPWNSPDFPHVKIEHWTNWKGFENKAFAINRIKSRRAECTKCKCSENGKIIPAFNSGCRAQLKADLCSLAIAKLDDRKPATDPDATVADYQNALNSIPLTVRLRNRDFEWRWGGRSVTYAPGSLEADNNNIVIPPELGLDPVPYARPRPPPPYFHNQRNWLIEGYDNVGPVEPLPENDPYPLFGPPLGFHTNDWTWYEQLRAEGLSDSGSGSGSDI